MDKKKKTVDCPHCGQDLSLSPNAAEEIAEAYDEGYSQAEAKAEVLVKALEDIQKATDLVFSGGVGHELSNNTCKLIAKTALSEYKSRE